MMGGVLVKCVIAASGGKDSARLAAAALAKGWKPYLCCADTGYLPEVAFENLREQSAKLGCPLIVYPMDKERLLEEYRKGFRELRKGASHFHSVCLRCHTLIHETIQKVADLLGIEEVWFGIRTEEVEAGNLEGMMDFEDERWPYAENYITEEEADRAFDQYDIDMTESPIRTNCYINWLIVDECLRLGRPNPYKEFFQDMNQSGPLGRFGWSLLMWLINTGIRTGLVGNTHQLRKEILDGAYTAEQMKD